MTDAILDYIPIAVMLILALVIPFVIMFIVKQITPRNPARFKNTTYEGGKDPIGEAQVRFNISYYLLAIVFVLFDVEVLFLYPWAVCYKSSVVLEAIPGFTMVAVVAMTIFLIIALVIGDIYAWKKGAFTWTR
ncbi:MAG: NAD(P)H-quinone oxidoreductase subunit 3 [Methanosarcinales archaeon]|jgi:NADH-quinone oxidoreductase subunit A|nr:NAD(P)H-quinone oxidoreductase subunit 3 [Methanosarcinales archaeon]